MIVTDKDGKKYNLTPVEKESTDNLTYLDILKKLKPQFYINNDNEIQNCEEVYSIRENSKDYNLLTSEEECQKLQVKTKLQNLAAYFNGDWKSLNQDKVYYICLCDSSIEIVFDRLEDRPLESTVFKTREDCQKAIEILGDELKILFE